MGDIRDRLNQRERAALDAVTEALDDAQVLVVEHIDTRTRRGMDVDGRPFRRYSKSYQKRKGGSARVNLRLTGDMLGDLDVRREGVFQRVVHLRSNFSNLKGIVHQQGSKTGMPIRRWFGMTEDATKRLQVLFSERLRAAQRRLGTDVVKKVLTLNL